jgi:uncharacterized lipoprotein YajG
MIYTTMKLLSIIFLGFFLTACSTVNDAVTFGKKCVVKDDKVVYSYVWIYNKESGLNADKEQCNEIEPR